MQIVTNLFCLVYILRTLPGKIRLGLDILFSITIFEILTPNLLEIPHNVSPRFTTYKVCDKSFAFDVGTYKSSPVNIKLTLDILLILANISTVVSNSLAILDNVSPDCTIYGIVLTPFALDSWLAIGITKVSPAYIKFGFDILFSSTSLAIVVLYSIASSDKVAPLGIIILW